MLGREITALRKARKWSMSELAKRLDVDANLVVDWENEALFPTKKHCEMLAQLAASRPVSASENKLE